MWDSHKSLLCNAISRKIIVDGLLPQGGCPDLRPIMGCYIKQKELLIAVWILSSPIPL